MLSRWLRTEATRFVSPPGGRAYSAESVQGSFEGLIYKRRLSSKSRGSDTLPLQGGWCLGVRGWKLDTYGIYINDLWKNILFSKFLFFLMKNLETKNIFSKNPEIHKIRKSWNHKIFGFFENHIFSIQDFSSEKIKFPRKK